MVLPKGLIIVETARFNLLGVLLKLNVRPIFILVLEANLKRVGEHGYKSTDANYEIHKMEQSN